MYRSYEKTKGTLRPRNYLKFPSVKVIAKEITYKSLKNSKKANFSHFSRTNDENVVPEKIFKGFQYVICKTCSNRSGLSIAPTLE